MSEVPESTPCANCGDTTRGRYCPSCGQRRADVRVSLRRLVADVLEDQLSINATLPRTLRALIFLPGTLTVEYLRGRIASYVPPFRLYIATSLIFFLILSMLNRYETIASFTDASDVAAADSATAEAAEPQTVEVEGDSVVADAEANPSGTERENRRSGVRLTVDSDSVVVNTGSDVIDRIIEERIAALQAMGTEEATRAISEAFVENVPTAIFVLLPVFALLLKVFYIRKRRFYVEHFVFALHIHAFAFLLFTLMIPLPDIVQVFTPLLLGLYLWIAMKRVYQQGLFMTTVKFGAVAVSYSMIVGVAVLATVFIAALTV